MYLSLKPPLLIFGRFVQYRLLELKSIMHGFYWALLLMCYV